MDWYFLLAAIAVVVALVVFDFVTERRSRRLPSSAYFHDRIEPADIEQWKAKREAEEHERQLDHNLRNQQQPIPWQQVRKAPPPPAPFPPKPKRHYPRTKTTTIPMGSTHTASRTARANGNKFTYNDQDGGVTDQAGPADSPEPQATTE